MPRDAPLEAVEAVEAAVEAGRLVLGGVFLAASQLFVPITLLLGTQVRATTLFGGGQMRRK